MRSETGQVDAELTAQVLRDAGLAVVSLPVQASASVHTPQAQPTAGAVSAAEAATAGLASALGEGAWPSAAPAGTDADGLLRPLWQQVAELERAAIARALQTTGGNKLAAARLLGISRAKLYAAGLS